MVIARVLENIMGGGVTFSMVNALLFYE